MIGCGTCSSGLLDESFGCGGPTLASELQQSQLSDVLQRTRVQWELFDYNNRERTVSNANLARVTGVFQSRLSAISCQLSATRHSSIFIDTAGWRVLLFEDRDVSPAVAQL